MRLLLPSKYSPSGSTTLMPWLQNQIIRGWYSVPSYFTQPYNLDRRFVFVCGCGHSGTTLTAAKIGNHPSALLIGRETYGFSPLNGLGCSKRIITEWDYFRERDGKEIVIEKTPKHIHSIKRIRKVLPEARLIITIRNPLDNIASLYSRFGSVEYAIHRWIVDNKVTVEFQEKDFIKVIKYEDITSDPVDSFRDLVEFSGLSWDPDILGGKKTAYTDVGEIENMLVRSRQVEGVIRKNSGGWKKILSRLQYRKIKTKTKSISASIGYSDFEDFD